MIKETEDGSRLVTDSPSGGDAAFDCVPLIAERMSDYGASVQEIEDSVLELMKALGLKGHIVLFNTTLLTSFSDSGVPRLEMRRFGPSRLNVDRLEQVKRVWHGVVTGKLQPPEACEEIRRIDGSSQLYGKWLEVLSWPLISAGFAFIYMGTWREALCAAIISLLLRIIDRSFPGNARGTGLRLSITVSAFVAALSVEGIARIVGPISPAIAVISCLMRFMPGYTLTQAVHEIASRRLVSGLAHLADAVATLLLLSAGVSLGLEIASHLPGTAPDFSPPVPAPWQIALAVVAISVGFLSAYQIRKGHIAAVIAGSLAVTAVWLTARSEMGIVQGTGVAALLAAFLGNSYARLRNCSDLIIKVPAAIILVPGVFAYRSLLELMNGATVPGMAHFLTAIAIAGAIAAGYLFMDTLFPPPHRRISRI